MSEAIISQKARIPLKILWSTTRDRARQRESTHTFGRTHGSVRAHLSHARTAFAVCVLSSRRVCRAGAARPLAFVRQTAPVQRVCTILLVCPMCTPKTVLPEAGPRPMPGTPPAAPRRCPQWPPGPLSVRSPLIVIHLRQRPTAHCLLPTAICSLLTAHCSLLTARCLLLAACGRPVHLSPNRISRIVTK